MTKISTTAASEKFIDIIKAMNDAPTEPSPACTNESGHAFEGVMHMDGQESYTWLYRCNHCLEYVKQETQRTGADREYWD